MSEKRRRDWQEMAAIVAELKALAEQHDVVIVVPVTKRSDRERCCVPLDDCAYTIDSLDLVKS